MNTDTKRWDSIVGGAGLAGLMAAVCLQQGGHQVLLLEQRDTPGGKCGVAELDGYRFTIGCNDFGSSMPGRLANVGVDVEFKNSTSYAKAGSSIITTPPNLSTIGTLLKRAPGLWRLIRSVRNRTHPSIGQIMENNVKSSHIIDMVGLLAYALGTPVQDMTTESLAAAFSKKWNYGMDKFMVPVPSVQAITDGLVQRFKALGGTLQLGVTFEGCETKDNYKLVQTSEGPQETRFIATTQEREYKGRPGLSVSQLLMAVPKDFPYIKQRTLIHMPAGVKKWMKKLDQGELPEEYGFHAFKDQEGDDYYTIVSYTLMPRGLEDPDEPFMQQMEAHLLNQLETYIPGLQDALLFKRFLSPQQYFEQWGLTCELTLAITDPDDDYPPMYDHNQDIYYIGNGVDIPPGDHANSALLSGEMAAEMILKRESQLQQASFS